MTDIPISKRIKNITASQSVGLAAIVNDLKKEGKKIISLNVGESDLELPEQIKQATINAINNHHYRYDLVAGLTNLRIAIIKKFNDETEIQWESSHVQISNGSKQNLYNIFQTLLDIDSEVIIPIPYWVTYPESVKLAGGTPVFVPCDQNFLPDLNKLKACVTDKTRAIIINTPNNPTGRIFDEKTIMALLEITIKNNLILISDEAYESLIFDNQKFPCPHKIMQQYFPEHINKVITVRTFSKSHMMTGFRMGYSIAESNFTSELNKLQSHLTGNNCTFAQYGALAAINLNQNFGQKIKNIMQARRDLAFKLCKQIFPKTKNPEGAFYLFSDIRNFLGERFKTDNDFCEFLLKEAGVAVLPGSAFGLPGFLRISFAGSVADIEQGLTLIKEALT